MATNNKPANTFRCGSIKATIWQNVSEKGPFFATTFSRPFKALPPYGILRLILRTLFFPTSANGG